MIRENNSADWSAEGSDVLCLAEKRVFLVRGALYEISIGAHCLHC